VLLADEINRTPPKTQAALLEAMGESQVSTDGVTRPLPQPFVVLATDNPIEYEGTYPLPEAQLDRFALRVRVGYLPHADEVAMVRRRLDRGVAETRLSRVLGGDDVMSLRAVVERVDVHDDVVDYAVRLVAATRQHPQVTVGVSPRGALALVQVARAAALLESRDFATPDDIKRVAVATLAHRLTIRPELWLRQVRGEDVVAQLLDTVPPPVRPSR
jgi:MoxR-like ATPase